MRRHALAAILFLLVLGGGAAVTLFSGTGGPERPEIAQGLPANANAATAEFSKRLAEAFAAGTPVAVIRERLAGQGFTIAEAGGRAVWQGSLSVACRMELIVRWRDTDGVLAAPASGQVGLVCL
jgi:hypothetical protein